MINIKDQEMLFKLIADYLDQDITCAAIGGTAMMFQNYKNTTKDIDLIFQTESDRKVFIKALEQLGYSQKSLKLIYDEKRQSNKNKPLIYSRGEERFDLFVKDVFGLKIDFDKIIQRNDFIGKKELIILILPKEYLILLKAVTNREKDYEDIETIIKIEKNIDWDFIIEEALRNKEEMKLILINLEEKLQQLRKITFIKQEIFDKIYAAEQKYKRK